MSIQNEIKRNICALHCVGAWLPTTENWLYRLIRHQQGTQTRIASDRMLDGSFVLLSAVQLRSPLQPRLVEREVVSGWRRIRRAATRLTYPAYLCVALRGQRVNIVHSHFAQVGWRFRKVAQRLGVPHVVSFYGWDYERLAHGSPKWCKRLSALYATADCFVCEGPHGAELLARNGCPKNKIRVAPLGVEPQDIPVFQRSKQRSQLRLLQIASFREKKGHLDTLHAFASALRQRPDMHLTLIGASPGPVFDAVTQANDELGIADKISLQPGIAFDQLHVSMRDHDVFIHPSRHAADGDCEGGAPVVLLDAQATGMPVIATTHCDIPQEVVDGVTGTLCAEGDVTALADAIVHFCDMDQADYDRCATAARQHIEAHFDARNCAARVEAIYRDVLNSRAQG